MVLRWSCAWWLGREEYALEDSLIEPFENDIRTSVEFGEIATHIRETRHSLPGPGYHKLVVPEDVRLPRGEGERQRALQHLVDWIVESTGAMQQENSEQREPWRSPYRRDTCIREKPPGLSCTFELSRWPDAALMGRRPSSLLRGARLSGQAGRATAIPA